MHACSFALLRAFAAVAHWFQRFHRKLNEGLNQASAGSAEVPLLSRPPKLIHGLSFCNVLHEVQFRLWVASVALQCRTKEHSLNTLG